MIHIHIWWSGKAVFLQIFLRYYNDAYDADDVDGEDGGDFSGGSGGRRFCACLRFASISNITRTVSMLQ